MPARPAVVPPAAGAARLLAFDTATERIAAAVSGPAGWVTLDAAGGAAASAMLLAQLQALLAQGGVQPGDIDAIAFGRGPGAFTGLRTAAAVAQGLAFGLGVPVLPLDSLLVVAEDAHAQAGAPAVFEVGVAMDARMDEAYAAGYRRDGDRWQVIDAPALCSLPALQASWQQRRWTAVAGSALAVYGARLAVPAGSTVFAQAADRAGALGRLAQQAFAAGQAVDAAQALPLYLRDRVAQTTAERAAAAAGAGAGASAGAGVGAGAGAGAGASTPATATVAVGTVATAVVTSAAGAAAAATADAGAAAGAAAAAPSAAGLAATTAAGLRPMLPADLDAVHAVEVRSYGHPWSRGNFADSLHAGHLAEVLHADAADGGALLGYFVAQPGVDELHLLNVTVAPEHQGRGLGRRLLAAVQAQGRGRGLSTLWLEVRHGNTRARSLYRRLGFEEVGLRRGYYPAGVQREDAVVMRLVLGDAATAAAPAPASPPAAVP